MEKHFSQEEPIIAKFYKPTPVSIIGMMVYNIGTQTEDTHALSQMQRFSFC